MIDPALAWLLGAARVILDRRQQHKPGVWGNRSLSCGEGLSCPNRTENSLPYPRVSTGGFVLLEFGSRTVHSDTLIRGMA